MIRKIPDCIAKIIVKKEFSFIYATRNLVREDRRWERRLYSNVIALICRTIFKILIKKRIILLLFESMISIPKKKKINSVRAGHGYRNKAIRHVIRERDRNEEGSPPSYEVPLL